MEKKKESEFVSLSIPVENELRAPARSCASFAREMNRVTAFAASPLLRRAAAAAAAAAASHSQALAKSSSMLRQRRRPMLPMATATAAAASRRACCCLKLLLRRVARRGDACKAGAPSARVRGRGAVPGCAPAAGRRSRHRQRRGRGARRRRCRDPVARSSRLPPSPAPPPRSWAPRPASRAASPRPRRAACRSGWPSAPPGPSPWSCSGGSRG